MAKIMLNNVRISFPSLFRNATFNGEETKFEGTFLIGKKEGKATIDEIDAAIKGIMREDLKGTKLAPDKICFKDGDNIDYAGYAGNMSIKASSTKRRPSNTKPPRNFNSWTTQNLPSASKA